MRLEVERDGELDGLVRDGELLWLYGSFCGSGDGVGRPLGMVSVVGFDRVSRGWDSFESNPVNPVSLDKFAAAAS